MLLINIFLGSFIFFYPDVVAGQDLPVTGGLAAVCMFVVSADQAGDPRFGCHGPAHPGRLPGSRSGLYLFPYILGVQLTNVHGRTVSQLADFFTSSRNTDLALPLCYISAALVGIMGLAAVIYNLRQATSGGLAPRTSRRDR